MTIFWWFRGIFVPNLSPASFILQFGWNYETWKKVTNENVADKLIFCWQCEVDLSEPASAPYRERYVHSIPQKLIPGLAQGYPLPVRYANVGFNVHVVNLFEDMNRVNIILPLVW